jgi:hypothetical protein
VERERFLYVGTQFVPKSACGPQFFSVIEEPLVTRVLGVPESNETEKVLGRHAKPMHNCGCSYSSSFAEPNK